jgi:hypothetical protein
MPLVFLEMGPQDPFFGIQLENVVDLLTRLNWSTKAIVRLGDAGPHYIWISRGEKGGRGKPKKRFYQVGVDGVERKQKDLEADFPYLKDALAYANGKDDGELGKQTRAARREDWPPGISKEPHWTVFFPSQMLRS